MRSASVEWYDGVGAKGISCELKETFVEYFCCFIWLTAYKRKDSLINVKEKTLKSGCIVTKTIIYSNNIFWEFSVGEGQEGVRMTPVPFPMRPYWTLHLKCFGEEWTKEGGRIKGEDMLSLWFVYEAGAWKQNQNFYIFSSFWWNQSEGHTSTLCPLTNNLCCRCSEHTPPPISCGHIRNSQGCTG